MSRLSHLPTLAHRAPTTCKLIVTANQGHRRALWGTPGGAPKAGHKITLVVGGPWKLCHTPPPASGKHPAWGPAEGTPSCATCLPSGRLGFLVCKTE